MSGWFTFVPEYIHSLKNNTVIKSFGLGIKDFINAPIMRDYLSEYDYTTHIDLSKDAVSDESLLTFSYANDGTYGNKPKIKLTKCTTLTTSVGKQAFGVSLPSSIPNRTKDVYLDYLRILGRQQYKDIKTRYGYMGFNIPKDSLCTNELFLRLLEIKGLGKYNESKKTIYIESENKSVKVSDEVLQILTNSGYRKDFSFNILEQYSIMSGFKGLYEKGNISKDDFIDLLKTYSSNIYSFKGYGQDYVQISLGRWDDSVIYRLEKTFERCSERDLDYLLGNGEGDMVYLSTTNWEDMVMWDNDVKILHMNDIDDIIEDLNVRIRKISNEIDIRDKISSLESSLKSQTNLKESTLNLYMDIITNWNDDANYLNEEIESLRMILEEFKLFKTLLNRAVSEHSYDSIRILYSLAD